MRSHLRASFLPLLLAFATVAHAEAPAAQVPINDSHMRLIGRTDDRDPAHPRLAYPATGLEFRFKGTGATLQLTADTPNSARAINALLPPRLGIT